MLENRLPYALVHSLVWGAGIKASGTKGPWPSLADQFVKLRGIFNFSAFPNHREIIEQAAVIFEDAIFFVLFENGLEFFSMTGWAMFSVPESAWIPAGAGPMP
ncbi:MAG: hypothetical protein R2874_09245 [Desulfobacterales bacterium]